MTLEQIVNIYSSSISKHLVSRRAVIDEEGPAHNKKFTSIVKIDGIIMGKGTAGSKKASEQEAAKDALKKAQNGD